MHPFELFLPSRPLLPKAIFCPRTALFRKSKELLCSAEKPQIQAGGGGAPQNIKKEFPCKMARQKWSEKASPPFQKGIGNLHPFCSFCLEFTQKSPLKLSRGCFTERKGWYFGFPPIVSEWNHFNPTIRPP